MSRVINFDKGSKGRIRRIRWTFAEKASAGVLLLILVALCILVALWDASRYPDSSHKPQLELRH